VFVLGSFLAARGAPAPCARSSPGWTPESSRSVRGGGNRGLGPSGAPFSGR
jgi:hypothetical protein